MRDGALFFFGLGTLEEGDAGWERCQNGRLTASPIVRENCKLALAGLRQCNSPSRYTRQTPILAKPPAGIPFLSLCTGKGKNRTAAAGGSS